MCPFAVRVTVDALDLGGDTGGDMLEQVEGHVLHGGGHGVHGIDRTDDHTPLVRALIVADADRFDVRDRSKILPHLALQAVLGKLLTEDGVGLPDGLQAVTGDGAQAAHAQAGAGEGVAPQDVVRDAHGGAQFAHLVLEQHLQGFYQLEVQVLRQAAHVVVALDRLHSLGAGLDDVGINGALAQELMNPED